MIRNKDPPFLAPYETCLVKGATALLALEGKCEPLHAAAYGYASSYTSGVMESGLTVCVEGIERLTEAYEQSRGLTRETVEKKRWSKLGKAARKLATPLAETGIRESLGQAQRSSGLFARSMSLNSWKAIVPCRSG